MSIFTEKNGKKSLPRLIYIKILLFFGLIGLSAVAMRPLQSALHQGMFHIRANFIERIETITGMKIRYSSIHPNIFGSFDIRNLRLIKNENAFLYVSRVRISFSLTELILRKKTAIHGIQVERPSSRLDLEKDREIIEFFSSLGKKEFDGKNETPVRISDFFPKQADFRIRDCFISVSDGAVTYLIQNMNINIGGAAGEFLFDGKLDAEVTYTGILNKTLSAKTEVGVTGEWSLNSEEGRAEIVFSSITAEQENRKREGVFFLFSAKNTDKKTLFDARPLNFGLAFRERTLNLHTLGDNAAYNASFKYNTETGGMDAAINCKNFSVIDLVRLSDNGGNISRLFSMAVNGGASLTQTGGALQYNVDFQGGNSLKPDDSFIIRAYGSEKAVVVDEFSFFASPPADGPGLFHGNFGLSGSVGFAPLTPSGTIFFDRFRLAPQDYIDAVFFASSQKNEIKISGETVVIGQYVFDNIDIFLFPSENDLIVSVLGLCEGGGEFNFEAILNYRPVRLEASVTLDSFSAAYLAGIVSPFAANINIPSAGMDLLRDTSIDAEVFFTTDFNHIVYNAPGINIKTGGASGTLSFSGTDRQFTLSEGIFTKHEDERDFLVSAHVDFSNPMDLGFYIDANYFDLSWHIEGQILDGTMLIIRDPNGLHVYGSISNSGAMSGYLEGIEFPVPVNGRPVYLNFFITLRYTAADFWYFDVANFEAHGLVPSDGSSNSAAYLRISGAADQDGASFRNLMYSDKKGDLAGGADFSWDSDFSYVQFIVSITDGQEAGENYLIEGLLKDRHFDVNASVSGMRADRFISESGTVLVNGEASFSWTSPQSFNARLNLASLYARLNENEIQASGGVLFTNDELAVYNLRLDYANVNVFLPVLQLNRAENLARMNADIRGFVLEKRLESRLELNASFKQTDSWVEIMQALNSIEGSINVDDTQYGDVLHEPFAVVFSRNSGSLSVSGGPKNMLRMEMDSDGNFFTSLSAPLPIRSSVVGNYKKGFIDAHCNDFFIDLSALWAMLPPVRDFNIAGGYVTAKMDIRGPIRNPEFFGAGKGTSFRLQVPNYVSQDIRPVPFNIAIEGNEMVFNQVALSSGKGKGTVDGWLHFEKWIPVNIGLDITIPRESPIPYNLNITGFRANGDASGQISIILENSVVEIDGDLYANNTEMGVSFDETRHTRTDPDSSSNPESLAIINLTITTGSVVEFVWPNTNMPILRANPEMGTVMKVSADTLSGQYSLNSDIMIRSGELYYFDRSFYIRRGNLVFRENEQQFNPRLSARAEIRDRTDSGPVTISMIIENEPLLSFIPRFEANPVLTQLEIYSLLGQNLYDVAGNENVDTAQHFIVSSTTDIVAQFVANSELFNKFTAVRQFERQIRNFLKLDMFSVRTRFLQNAVSNAATALGPAPVDMNSRVGNYFDNTTVFIGKYVGQDMFIQGMLSMRYEENNPDFGGLKFEPDIGIELQGPLFNIRWDFFPYHPENWWINDNSITITVSKTF